MTDFEYLVCIDGRQVGHYVDARSALIHAQDAKSRDHDQNVVLVVATVAEAEMASADFRVRPFAVVHVQAEVIPIGSRR